jgi:hypothetical protein
MSSCFQTGKQLLKHVQLRAGVNERLVSILRRDVPGLEILVDKVRVLEAFAELHEDVVTVSPPRLSVKKGTRQQEGRMYRLLFSRPLFPLPPWLDRAAMASTFFLTLGQR